MEESDHENCWILVSSKWCTIGWASQGVLVVKNLTANAKDGRDMSSIPVLGRSPGGGHNNAFQHSCLENPLDRGALRVTVHSIAKIQTQLK